MIAVALMLTFTSCGKKPGPDLSMGTERDYQTVYGEFNTALGLSDAKDTLDGVFTARYQAYVSAMGVAYNSYKTNGLVKAAYGGSLSGYVNFKRSGMDTTINEDDSIKLLGGDNHCAKRNLYDCLTLVLNDSFFKQGYTYTGSTEYKPFNNEESDAWYSFKEVNNETGETRVYTFDSQGHLACLRLGTIKTGDFYSNEDFTAVNEKFAVYKITVKTTYRRYNINLN